MVTVLRSPLGPRAFTVLLWALAAGCSAYWGLRLFAGSGASPEVPPAASATMAPPDTPALARVLGAGAAAQAAPRPELASRFALLGVVAGAPGGNAALIAIDGQPARPFKVGSALEEGLVLQSAQARQATLAASLQGPPLVQLDMPPLPN